MDDNINEVQWWNPSIEAIRYWEKDGDGNYKLRTESVDEVRAYIRSNLQEFQIPVHVGTQYEYIDAVSRTNSTAVVVTRYSTGIGSSDVS